MQSVVDIEDERISFTYKFAYHLCGNRKAAEKLTELSIIAHVLSITPQEVQKIVAQGRRRVVASKKMLTE